MFKLLYKNIKIWLSLLLLGMLVSCGGGGGSAGGSSSTTSSSSTVTGVPTITISIVDASSNTVTSNSIGSGSVFYVSALVKNASGSVVANKLVNFTTDATKATLAQSSALTDSNGIAKVQISPVSLTQATAGNVVAAATVDTVAVSNNLDYQTASANVTLTNFAVTPPATITALQTAAVTVQGRVNGALSGNVLVTFSAGCGSFSPASASTNSAGTASSTYQSAANCSGAVQLSASATGATTQTTNVTVNAAQAENIVFTSATPNLIVTSTSNNGVKQSTIKFQVLNAAGTGMASQNVLVNLNSATQSAGVTFSGGVVTQQSVNTDSNGYASVTVNSGSLPTPVIVTAALASNTNIQASSTNISVTSGVATQNAASLSVDKFAIEGFNIDGQTANFTFRVADRQGNPVPSGSQVNFVASHGQVTGACTLDATSKCSVTYTSQGLRPTSGRAAILAYMDGEESFIDANGNNRWDNGETFYDVGTLYRDDDESGTFSAGEQTYPGGATGGSACAANTYSYPSVVNTCDGTWSSNIRVRQQVIIALSTTAANITLTQARTSTGFSVQVADQKGNNMPTGTTVSAAVKTNGATCTVSSTSPNVVRNSSNAGQHRIGLDGAADCGTVRVEVTVTPPSGSATVVSF